MSLLISTGSGFDDSKFFSLFDDDESPLGLCEGLHAQVLTTGDFNGDTYPDLVAADVTSNTCGAFADTLFLLTNTAGGGPQPGWFPPVRFNMTSGTSPRAIAAADLNDDGRDDIVTGNASSTISTRFGDGAGGFGEQRDLFVDYPIFFVTVGDIDNTGTPDVVTPNISAASGTVVGIHMNGDPDSPFEPSRGDYTSLIRNGDGTYTRRLKDGTVYQFSAAGLQTSMTTANGQATAYQYNGAGSLTLVTDPAGLQTTLAYSGGLLSAVTDPAGRTTSFGRDGAGNLATITDPDGKTRGFTYDGAHRLTTQTSKRSFVTTYSYGPAGRNTGASRPDGSSTAILPAELDGLVDPSSGVGTAANPAPPKRRSSIVARVTDGRNKDTTYRTDDFGAVISVTDPLGRVTTTTRDQFSNPTVTVLPNGARNLSTFDSLGNLVELWEADQSPGTNVPRRRCFEYDPIFNRVALTTDPDGFAGYPCSSVIANTIPNQLPVKRTTYQYDAAANLRFITDQDGFTRQYTYESNGLPKTFTDERGKTWSATYDAAGNLKTITDPLGAVTTIAHDAAGHVTTVTDATGAPEERSSIIGYDAMGRVASITDGSGVTVEQRYDFAGNLEEIELETGEIISREYDERDRVSAINDPRTGRTEYEYDGEGALMSTIEEPINLLERVTTYTYDDAGQLDTVTDALGGVQNFDYDSLGNVTRVTDAKGQRTEFAYDARSRRSSRTKKGTLTQPFTVTEIYGYDRRDNLTSLKRGTDPAFALTYDNLSRLTKIAAPANGLAPAHSLDASYDASGNLKTADVVIVGTPVPDSTLDFTYDDAGRLQTEMSTIAGSAAVTLTSSYDLAGNRVGLADSFGGNLVISRDGAGRMSSLSTAAGPVALGHDLSGRLSGILFPSDASALYGYDTEGRVAVITHKDATESLLASYTMGYNTAGSITSIIDNAPARTRGFGYDDLERLVSEQTLPSPAGAFSYDAVGNRTSSPLSASHDYDSLNRLTADDGFTYTYDNNGSLTSKTAVSGPEAGEVTTFRWDSRTQLVGIDLPGGAQASYRYDALGRRIEKMAGGQMARYIYDREDIALETSGLGALAKRYRHGDGIDRPLVVEDVATEEPFFLHADHLGSIRLVTDEDGVVASRYDYDAYGARTVISEDLEQPYAFTGREWDDESGMYYYRARYYDPTLGRFLSEDPVGFAGGDLNLYRYVGNGPMMANDPFGLWMWPPDVGDDATDDAENSGLPGPHNGQQDAFRHCLASCRMAVENGVLISDWLGWINEKKGDWTHGQPQGERAMDDKNNSCGRKFAEEEKDCQSACMQATLDGTLKTNPGITPPYSPPYTPIYPPTTNPGSGTYPYSFSTPVIQ